MEKYEISKKKEDVSQMFNRIAPRYDFLNRFLSFGIDKIWRRKAIKILKKTEPKKILDLASGTGDLAIEMRKIKPQKIIGIDISEGMIEIGRQKVKKRGLEKMIELQIGDSENLNFPDNCFDAVTVAFGVRNFEHLEKGLQEMKRVLKNNGKLLILEFSLPKKNPFKALYLFYFKYILPIWGKIISRDKNAYTYLPATVMKFPSGKKFNEKLEETGFSDIENKELTFGIATIYTASK